MADPVTPPTDPVVPNTVPQENAAVPNVQAAAPVQESTGSKGMLWVIVAAFVVVAILIGVGIYMYMQVKETNPAFQQISENVQQSLTSVENDLAGIPDDSVESDFAEVDKDLNSL